MTGNKYKNKREMLMEFLHQVELIRAKHVADARKKNGVVRRKLTMIFFRERLQRWSVSWGYQLGRCVGDRLKKLARSRAGFKLKFFN